MGNYMLQVGEKEKQYIGITLMLPSHYGSVHRKHAKEQPEACLVPKRVRGKRGTQVKEDVL